MDRIEMRIADARTFDELDGTPGDGRSALWVRLPGVLEMSAASLAIVGDYVPFGISQSLGHRAGGNSLDNTLRVASRDPTDWILADIRVHAVAHGFGHGLVHLWAAGRHAARHRQPVHDRARVARGPRRPREPRA